MTTIREEHVEASVMRATLDKAPLITAQVVNAVSRHGYDVALYGSTLKFGEGRDYDFIVWPTVIYPAPGGIDGIVGGMKRAGFEILKIESDGLPGYTGILATFQGYAIDITVRP